MTPLLFKFWKRAGFVPLYMRQTTNDLTGEHSCIMIRGLNKNEDEAKRWLGDFSIGASLQTLAEKVEARLTSRRPRRRLPQALHRAPVVQVPRVQLDSRAQHPRGGELARHGCWTAK